MLILCLSDPVRALRLMSPKEKKNSHDCASQKLTETARERCTGDRTDFAALEHSQE